MCIASAVRIPTLGGVYLTTDHPWDCYEADVWTLIEINIGIVCANLPVMRPLFVRLGAAPVFASFRSTQPSTGQRPHDLPNTSARKPSKKSLLSSLLTETTMVESVDVDVGHDAKTSQVHLAPHPGRQGAYGDA